MLLLLATPPDYQIPHKDNNANVIWNTWMSSTVLKFRLALRTGAHGSTEWILICTDKRCTGGQTKLSYGKVIVLFLLTDVIFQLNLRQGEMPIANTVTWEIWWECSLRIQSIWGDKTWFFSSTVFIKIEIFVLILDVLQIYFSFLIKLQIVNGGISFLIYFLCLAITCLYIPKIFSLNKWKQNRNGIFQDFCST